MFIKGLVLMKVGVEGPEEGLKTFRLGADS
jgi:hypothetical protein